MLWAITEALGLRPDPPWVQKSTAQLPARSEEEPEDGDGPADEAEPHPIVPNSAVKLVDDGGRVGGPRRVQGESNMIAQSLLEALRAVPAAFDPGELAYLALTSKVELPVRDRLAWQLHNRLAEHGFRVAREWRRSDLAVLDDAGAPVALLEAKAFYSFDVARGMEAAHKHTVAIAYDLAKAYQLAPDAQVFALALCTTPLAPIDPPQQHLAKYAAGVNTAITEFGNPGIVRDKAREHVAARLATMGAVEEVNLGDGSAYELPVSVDTWLAGPVTGTPLMG